MSPVVSMPQFVIDEAVGLLDRLAFQINGALKTSGAECIHDLRVAIRRFTQLLVTLQPCFSRTASRKIHKYLKQTMSLAGNVRDYDIALEFLRKFDISEVAGLQEAFQSRREEAESALLGCLRGWSRQGLSARWRRELRIDSAARPRLSDAIEDTVSRRLPRMADRFFERGQRATRGSASAGEFQ